MANQETLRHQNCLEKGTAVFCPVLKLAALATCLQNGKTVFIYILGNRPCVHQDSIRELGRKCSGMCWPIFIASCKVLKGKTRNTTWVEGGRGGMRANNPC